MTRAMTSAMKTAVALQSSEFVHLLSLTFSGGTIYLCSGSNDIVYGGNTYSAVGGAMSFEPVQETPDLEGQVLRFTLDGVSQVAIAAFLAQNYIGRIATLYRAHLHATTKALIADPIVLFTGYMNFPWEVDENFREDGGGWATVTTSFVSPLVKFKQKRGIKANLTSHAEKYADDTFMQHIAAIPDSDVGWGPYAGMAEYVLGLILD